MSDTFDVFDPFEPLEAAAEEPVAGSSEPSREPRAPRRWTAPPARPTPPPDAQRTSAEPRPDAPARRLPTGADFEAVLDAVLFGEPAERAADEGADEGEPEGVGPAGTTASADEGADEGVGPASPALVPGADLAAFRAAALPELEGAVERLLGRGHLASLTDDLSQPEPTVVVRFRPNQGPLAAFGSTARKPARFELRLAPDLEGETQVVAGYTLGAPDAPFTLLSRARLSAVRGDWVAQRVVDFVRRTLGPD